MALVAPCSCLSRRSADVLSSSIWVVQSSWGPVLAVIRLCTLEREYRVSGSAWNGGVPFGGGIWEESLRGPSYYVWRIVVWYALDSQATVRPIKGWVESAVYMSVSRTPNLKGLVFLHHSCGFPAVLRQLSAVTSAVFVFSLFLTALGWADLWRRPEYWWVPFLSLWGHVVRRLSV